MPAQVLLTVLEVDAKSTTEFYPVLRRYGEIPLVKEDVQVASEQEAIIDAMLSTLGERAYVSSVQHRQDLFSGNRTLPTICVGHENTKGSLTKPWCDQVGLSAPELIRFEASFTSGPDVRNWQMVLDPSPH
jgi:hypothetical protein